MPVVRIPLVHKFGIISVSRAEQLLREGRRNQESAPPSPVKKTTTPTKISQSFIIKYNAASEVEREKLDRIVQRIFAQAKYKAGLHKTQDSADPSCVSVGAHSTHHQSPGGGRSEKGIVCDAWVEFILLCQCYGPHQEDVLLALATSLNHAPLSSVHIPSLLYMCGLCYQWLKSNVSMSGDSAQLRTGELMLLRILYLITLRLFYHHMVGTLQDICTREDIRQLKFDLEGFETRERVYRNFPEALLHWKVALEVGQVVVEKNTPKVLHDPSDPSILIATDNYPTCTMPSSSHNTSNTHQDERGLGESGKGYTMSSVLHQTLSVWRIVRSIGQDDAIATMLTSSEFKIDNWLESLLAVNILCLGSQLSLPVLSLLHSLAGGAISLSSHSHHQMETPHPPFSFTSRPHSASLFRDTPTITSRVSDDTDKTKHSQDSALPKKGTRFKLPGLEIDEVSFGDVVSSNNRRARVETLNVLGMQPSFREPYPESVYTDVTQNINDDDDDDSIFEAGYHQELNSDAVHLTKPQEQDTYTGSAYTADVESVATQSLVDSELVPKTIDSSRASTHSQHLSGMGELRSELTLGEVSPSHSFIITSSPWLKSSTSNNGSNVDHSKLIIDAGGTHRSTYDDVMNRDTHTPDPRVDVKQLGENVCGEEELRSSLGESLDKVGMLGNPDESHFPHSPHRPVTEGVLGRNVTLSLFPRNVETRCTHYTHSSSALSGGAGVPGSRIAPSTIYQHSIYSPLTIDIEEEDEQGKGMLVSGGNVTGQIAEISHHPSFESWPSEVAVAYTLGICDVVIYGRTSHIQSSALQGLLQSEDTSGEGNIGLKQLAEFTLNDHSSSEYSAWMIRHCAVLGLSRVCHACKHHAISESIGSEAWSLLMERHTNERDSRVLEAYKMSQVCPDVDGPLLTIDAASLSSPLLAHIADGLAKIFLTPLTNTSPTTTTVKPSSKRYMLCCELKPNLAIDNSLHSFFQKENKIQPQAMKLNSPPKVAAKVNTHQKKTSIKRADFASRTLAALNSIVEQDWKREMQKERGQDEMLHETTEVYNPGHLT